MSRKSLLGWALHLLIVSSLSETFLPSILDPTSSQSLSNLTAPADNTTLTELAVNCNGAPSTRPGPASYASCQNAFTNTPGGESIETIGDRAAGEWYMNLPQRFMSGKQAPSLVLSRVDHVGDNYSN